MVEHITPFGVSLLIGLFIGIERERSHPAGIQAMGVRTFILVALLGTLVSTIQDSILTLAGSLFAFGIILISYEKSYKYQTKNKTKGITTEMSAVVVFFLGYLTPLKPLIAAVIGLVVLLALLSRNNLHAFSRDTVKTKEIYAAIGILAIGLGVLPFLPNHAIDPWRVFNPRLYVGLILVLAIIEFTGYIAIRIFGNKLGILLTAFFSGLISSTAAFLALSKLSKKTKQSPETLVASGLLATNAMLIEIIVLLSLISPALIQQLLTPIISMLAIGFLTTWPVLKNKQNLPRSLTPENPLDLKGIIQIATFIIGMLALIIITKRNIGSMGVQLISFLGGLFEIHSVNIANASLFIQGKLTLLETIHAIGLAIAASFITKFFILFTLSEKKFALRTGIYLLLMMITGTGTFIFFT